MSKRHLHTVLLVFLGLTLLPVAQGQSIHSRVGVGNMVLPQTARTQGLGVAGVAVTDYNEISLINPAGWYLPRLTAVTTKISSSRATTSLGGTNDYFGFEGFNFHFPIGRSVGIGVGFAPYSIVNYEFARNARAALPGSFAGDTLEYSLQQQGSGGIGGSFIGFGWRVTDHLAFGAATSFLVGEITVRRTLEVTTGDYLSRRVLSRTNIYGQNVIAGASYRNLIREGDNLGVRVEIPLSLLVKREDDYSVGDPETTNFGNLLWPWQFGFGYEIRLGQQWLAVTEGHYWRAEHDLSRVSLTNSAYHQNDGMQVGAGVERRANFNMDGWWNKLAWRAGVRWRQFLESDAAGNHSYGFRWVGGIGIPFGRGPLGPGTNRLDVSFFYDHRMSADSTNPTETITGIQLGFTVSEIWF